MWIKYTIVWGNNEDSAQRIPVLCKDAKECKRIAVCIFLASTASFCYFHPSDTKTERTYIANSI